MKYNNFSEAEQDLIRIGENVSILPVDENTKRQIYRIMIATFNFAARGAVERSEDILFPEGGYVRGSQPEVDGTLEILDQTIEFSRDFMEYVLSDKCRKKMTEIEKMVGQMLQRNGGNVEGFKRENRKPLSPTYFYLDKEDDLSPKRN